MKLRLCLRRIAPFLAAFIEIHVTQGVEDHELPNISGYACVRGNPETSRTGRVLLYIKEEIKYEIISVESCDRNWWQLGLNNSN